METTEKITIIESAIQAIDQYTIMKQEEKGIIVNPGDNIGFVESWEATELKDILYRQLGKLNYEQINTLE